MVNQHLLVGKRGKYVADFDILTSLGSTACTYCDRERWKNYCGMYRLFCCLDLIAICSVFGCQLLTMVKTGVVQAMVMLVMFVVVKNFLCIMKPHTHMMVHYNLVFTIYVTHAHHVHVNLPFVHHP